MSEKYEELIRSIELSKILLNSLECKQNPSFSAERTSLDVAFEDEILNIEYHSVDLNVLMGFNITAFNSENHIEDSKEIPEEDRLFQISFTLNLVYRLELDSVENVLKDY